MASSSNNNNNNNYNFSDEEFDDDYMNTVNKLEKKNMRSKYNKGMDTLWHLRRQVTGRKNPSMPRYSFKSFLKNPDVLDCYIKIEKWKVYGGQDFTFEWIPGLDIF